MVETITLVGIYRGESSQVLFGVAGIRPSTVFVSARCHPSPVRFQFNPFRRDLRQSFDLINMLCVLYLPLVQEFNPLTYFIIAIAIFCHKAVSPHLPQTHHPFSSKLPILFVYVCLSLGVFCLGISAACWVQLGQIWWQLLFASLPIFSKMLMAEDSRVRTYLFKSKPRLHFDFLHCSSNATPWQQHLIVVFWFLPRLQLRFCFIL